MSGKHRRRQQNLTSLGLTSLGLLVGLLFGGGGLLSGGSPVWAVQPDEMLADPGQEARARALGKDLRCLVCQNQSIDDSNAELARDLRVLVRERIRLGDSDRQVMDYLTARYGDFVLLKPPFKASTLLLWLAPLFFLLVGGISAALFMRRQPSGGRGNGDAVGLDADTPPLTAEEQTRLARLLAEGDVGAEGKGKDS